MTNRRFILAGLATASTALLSGCGTILYPNRAYQKKRGDLDPSIVILDGVGLFFFIIPGAVAFAVDFTTGAIYFPAGHEPGDRERTIFDQYDTKSETRLNRHEIEKAVKRKTGKDIDLTADNVRVAKLESLDQFQVAYDRLSRPVMFAAR